MMLMSSVLLDFLSEKKLSLKGKISKGWSSEIFLVEKKGKKFALKIEKEKSPRIRMVEREVQNLAFANKHKIGPKLVVFDFEKRIVLMEFVEGVPFGKWVFQNPSKIKLKKCLSSLMKQVKKMDSIGLSHGQLAGKGANILVKKNGLPVIIDFEKASQSRKCKNERQLNGFLFRNPNSALVKKISEILNS